MKQKLAFFKKKKKRRQIDAAKMKEEAADAEAKKKNPSYGIIYLSIFPNAHLLCGFYFQV